MPNQFSTFDEQGREYCHMERWHRWINQQSLFYRTPLDHDRVELCLCTPSDHLHDVPVGWNPHTPIDSSLSPYHCFHHSYNWSTIFEVFDFPQYGGDPSWKYMHLLAEQGHQNPWGEPLQLLSTASSFFDTIANRFAYFRGKFWKVLTCRLHYRPVQWITIPLVRRISPQLIFENVQAIHPQTELDWLNRRARFINRGGWRTWGGEVQRDVNWQQEGF